MSCGSSENCNEIQDIAREQMGTWSSVEVVCNILGSIYGDGVLADKHISVFWARGEPGEPNKAPKRHQTAARIRQKGDRIKTERPAPTGKGFCLNL